MNPDIDVELACESLLMRIRAGTLDVNQWADWIRLLGSAAVTKVLREMENEK